MSIINDAQVWCHAISETMNVYTHSPVMFVPEVYGLLLSNPVSPGLLSSNQICISVL